MQLHFLVFKQHRVKVFLALGFSDNISYSNWIVQSSCSIVNILQGLFCLFASRKTESTKNESISMAVCDSKPKFTLSINHP